MRSSQFKIKTLQKKSGGDVRQGKITSALFRMARKFSTHVNVNKTRQQTSCQSRKFEMPLREKIFSFVEKVR
jgi:hypothetical protein